MARLLRDALATLALSKAAEYKARLEQTPIHPSYAYEQQREERLLTGAIKWFEQRYKDMTCANHETDFVAARANLLAVIHAYEMALMNKSYKVDAAIFVTAGFEDEIERDKKKKKKKVETKRKRVDEEEEEEDDPMLVYQLKDLDLSLTPAEAIKAFERDQRKKDGDAEPAKKKRRVSEIFADSTCGSLEGKACALNAYNVCTACGYKKGDV